MAKRKLPLATIRKVALSFPGVEEATSYGTPAFKLGKKLLVRLHQDGASLVLKVGDATRDHLLQADHDTFSSPTTIAATRTCSPISTG